MSNRRGMQIFFPRGTFANTGNISGIPRNTTELSNRRNMTKSIVNNMSLGDQRISFITRARILGVAQKAKKRNLLFMSISLNVDRWVSRQLIIRHSWKKMSIVCYEKMAEHIISYEQKKKIFLAKIRKISILKHW